MSVECYRTRLAGLIANVTRITNAIFESNLIYYATFRWNQILQCFQPSNDLLWVIRLVEPEADYENLQFANKKGTAFTRELNPVICNRRFVNTR